MLSLIHISAQWYNVPGAFEAIKNTPVWAYHCKDGLKCAGDVVPPVSYTHLDVYKRQVQDPTGHGTQARGKQTLQPGGMFYPAQSGIWQTVWLERVPEN